MGGSSGDGVGASGAEAPAPPKCPFEGSQSSWLAAFCPYKKKQTSAESIATTATGATIGTSTTTSPSSSSGSASLSASVVYLEEAGGSAPATMAEGRASRLNKALLASGGGMCPMRGSGAAAASHGDSASSSSDQMVDDDRPFINPRNMMPSMLNDALPSDKVAFDKTREVSSIPKTGEDVGTSWVYPSPQQFYNALRRRGKVDEQDQLEKGNTMDSIVFAHNVTNERTWSEILEWEKMHYEKCKDPSLLSFVGKSEELSAGGYFSKYFRRRGAPFDRHDWLVDRCGTQQVRYIIDYYDDPDAADTHGLDISLVTRPAPDSFQNLYDRLRKPFWDRFGPGGVAGGAGNPDGASKP